MVVHLKRTASLLALLTSTRVLVQRVPVYLASSSLALA